MHLLQVKNLHTYFQTREGLVCAVDGVSFYLDRGELLGLVGESGCGKSITALSIMRLVAPPGKIVAGEILFDGRDLLNLSNAEMRDVRGNDVAMIFQDPMTSLNPVFTVGEQIAEALRLHRKLSRKAARAAAVDAMREVSIPDPELRVNDYPHQLSGGMRQRVMIAMALACDPKVLIADEPTTALDVTIQAQILELLNNLRRTRDLAVLFIDACRAVGLESEARPFRAHVTLARSRPAPSTLPDLPSPPRLEPWTVADFVLYESRLGGPAATYLELERYRLEGPEPSV